MSDNYHTETIMQSNKIKNHIDTEECRQAEQKLEKQLKKEEKNK